MSKNKQKNSINKTHIINKKGGGFMRGAAGGGRRAAGGPADVGQLPLRGNPFSDF